MLLCSSKYKQRNSRHHISIQSLLVSPAFLGQEIALFSEVLESFQEYYFRGHVTLKGHQSRQERQIMRYMYKPASPECGRFLPGFCPGQTLCYWPIAHCPAPAAALLDPSPDAEAWKQRHTHIQTGSKTRVKICSGHTNPQKINI